MSRIKASSNSLIICCFLLIITVILSTPHGVSSRLLSTNFPHRFGRGLNQNGDDDHSKSGIRGSESGHDGSATGGDNPPSGVGQMAPPTSATGTVYVTTPSSPSRPSGTETVNVTTPSPPSGTETVNMTTSPSPSPP